MRFRSTFCAFALAAAVVFLPSCMTSTLASAAVAGTGMAGNLPGVRSLLGNVAPQPAELVGRTLDYKGERHEANQTSSAVSGSILFGSDNPSVVCAADGTQRTVFYSRKSDEKAVVTITVPAGVETYRLTFTRGDEGSYTYEKRYGSEFATGEGQFTLN